MLFVITLRNSGITLGNSIISLGNSVITLGNSVITLGNSVGSLLKIRLRQNNLRTDCLPITSSDGHKDGRTFERTEKVIC